MQCNAVPCLVLIQHVDLVGVVSLKHPPVVFRIRVVDYFVFGKVIDRLGPGLIIGIILRRCIRQLNKLLELSLISIRDSIVVVVVFTL